MVGYDLHCGGLDLGDVVRCKRDPVVRPFSFYEFGPLLYSLASDDSAESVQRMFIYRQAIKPALVVDLLGRH